MHYRIKKVAVLGSGVMGSGIACQLANVGLEVLMLDILPKKPLETRQGKGKGNVEYWASPVRPGKILYEVAGVSEKDAKKAFELASAKLPMATTFTKRGANG